MRREMLAKPFSVITSQCDLNWYSDVCKLLLNKTGKNLNSDNSKC